MGTCDLFAAQPKGGAEGNHGALRERATCKCVEHH